MTTHAHPSPFFAALQAGLEEACRATAGAAQACARQLDAIDPDARRFAAQVPLMAAARLLPAPRLSRDAAHHTNNTASTAPPPVIFVHGLGGHPRDFSALGLYFSHRGCTQALALDVDGCTSIDAMASSLTLAIDDLHQRIQRPIALVCHSMGGLVARTALLDPEAAAKVASLTTLGSPHHGSDLARWARSELITPLRPGSELLQRLDAQLPWDARRMPPLTCFWSPSDLVIMPPQSACIPGARNIQAPTGTTHLSYLLQPGLWRQIFEAVDTPLAASYAPSHH